MDLTFDRVLTINLIGTTLVFYVAARFYLLPRLKRLRPSSILVPVLLVIVTGLIATEAIAGNSDCDARLALGPPTRDALLQARWREVSDAGQIYVYNRKAEGSPICEVMARSRIAAEPQTVFRVVTDFAHYTEFMPYTAMCRVERATASEFWVYQRLEFPFISNRHFVVKVVLHPCNGIAGFHGTVWHQDNEFAMPPDDTGAIQPRVNSGSWELWPAGNGRETEAVYYLHSDPGGALPAFLANLVNRRALPEVIRAVSQRCREARN